MRFWRAILQIKQNVPFGIAVTGTEFELVPVTNSNSVPVTNLNSVPDTLNEILISLRRICLNGKA
jgi:hypothetical protein